MSHEDQMTQALIESAEQLSAESSDEQNHEFEPEAHYNYYGDRGVADLFHREVWDPNTKKQHTSEKLYEIKSGSALDSATGANEIIRQFNRMRRYFYRDESRTCKASFTSSPTVRFELCFVASQVTYEHLVENVDQYRAMTESPAFSADRESETVVTFRHPDETAAMRTFTAHNQVGSQEWRDILQSQNSTAFDAIF